MGSQAAPQGISGSYSHPHLVRELRRLRTLLGRFAEYVRETVLTAGRGTLPDASPAAKVRELEEECLKVLALYQPEGTGQQEIVVILKALRELECGLDIAREFAAYVKDAQDGADDIIRLTSEIASVIQTFRLVTIEGSLPATELLRGKDKVMQVAGQILANETSPPVAFNNRQTALSYHRRLVLVHELCRFCDRLLILRPVNDECYPAAN